MKLMLVPSLRIIAIASLVPFLLLPVLNDMGIFSCFANEVPYPGDPCYMYDPEFPEIGKIACYDQTGQKICCNEGPGQDGENGDTFGGEDSGLDDAVLGAVVAGFVAAAAAIGIAASKGGLGKLKEAKKDSFTKSALKGHTPKFEKYSARPSWMHPETNTYGYKTTTSSDTSSSPPHVMGPGDFNLRSIEGVGITNPSPSNPSPKNVIYRRTASSVNLKWETPDTHDTSTGNVFEGYDVYYQERTPTSTDWITRHIAVPQQNEITIQNPPLQSQNFGVRAVYKAPDGSIFYSDGILGTTSGG